MGNSEYGYEKQVEGLYSEDIWKNLDSLKKYIDKDSTERKSESLEAKSEK